MQVNKNIEIERKFLVLNKSYREEAFKKVSIIQGYLSKEPDRVVRVRLVDNKGFITIKGSNAGLTRFEWEKEITSEDAELLLKLCISPLIEKTRYYVLFWGSTYEVDEFGGHLLGMVVAELELNSEDEEFARPAWLGEEVTGRAEFYNSNL